MERPKPLKIEELRKTFQEYDQDHVFRFWDTLSAAGQEKLARQATELSDFLPSRIAQYREARAILKQPKMGKIQPYPAIPLPEHGGDPKTFAQAHEVGLEILQAGRVGLLVVAGGQGTRLGFNGPKGALPIGPVSERSLFALQAQKLHALSRRLDQPVHWFVMTSPATDGPTRMLFEQMNYFGLPPENVILFSQGTVPAWTLDGKLILEEPDQIFESPGGHGDTFRALSDSGALDEMERRGLDRLFYYQVDNPLVQMADPTFLGFHELEQAEMSCKVIRKVDPMEKVGVMAHCDGRPSLVEYTELADEQRYAQDQTGQLRYWAGNIAIHTFNLEFLRRVADDNDRLLPYHASAKKIPFLSPGGHTISPDEPNGHKLERFVFDALPTAERVCVLEVRAQDEFAPVKNAQGKDSPDTVRDHLSQLYRGWLMEAGVSLPSQVKNIEIDHSIVDSAEELAQLRLDTWEQAGEAIRIETGTEK